ncbi:bifunctional DNA primase/polymerase [Corynebacterium oculi]|nr:bifunctional DNA primase/polymerase [Corynebacterium oculi]
MATTWQPGHPAPTHHPECDTHPAEEKVRAPHPRLGQLAHAAHRATLLMARAAPTAADSPQWVEFDQACADLHTIQRRVLHVDLPKAAMYYATACGWPVFPLKPGGKAPLTPRCFKDASRDPGQVAAWWGEHPEANIGLLCGEHFAVIDVDVPYIENQWWDIAADEGLHVYALAATASGGTHAYILPADGPAKNGVGVFGPKIDYRTTGGYVVAPYSRRADGPVWSWQIPPANVIQPAKKAG